MLRVTSTRTDFMAHAQKAAQQGTAHMPNPNPNPSPNPNPKPNPNPNPTPKALREIGFTVYGIGKPQPQTGSEATSAEAGPQP